MSTESDKKNRLAEIQNSLANNLAKLRLDRANNNESAPGVNLPAPSASPFLPAPKPQEKAPLCELKGNKWAVENQTSKLTVATTSINENVYIYNCKNATIFVQNKCKGIVIDHCTRTNVVADNLITTCELIDSKNCKFQIKEKVPTVSFDKSDYCSLILSPDSLDVKIISSKSSECNIMWPKVGTDDWIEQPVPSQFYHTIQNDKLTTEVSDLYSC
ncbi:hypothetical protein WA158_006872 [Blastocystis sp. Blastoise]